MQKFFALVLKTTIEESSIQQFLTLTLSSMYIQVPATCTFVIIRKPYKPLWQLTSMYMYI